MSITSHDLRRLGRRDVVSENSDAFRDRGCKQHQDNFVLFTRVFHSVPHTSVGWLWRGGQSRDYKITVTPFILTPVSRRLRKALAGNTQSTQFCVVLEHI